MENNPFSILFEPVKIGPKVTKNRFYQVPHCDGAGHLRPRTHAAMRRVKAEGGWGVISTQETEIHPTGDIAPSVEQRLWDDNDIPALRLMTDSLRDEGALSAIELVHNGHHAANLMSRAVPLAPVHGVYDGYDPVQARAMETLSMFMPAIICRSCIISCWLAIIGGATIMAAVWRTGCA
jgi:dimethylamine/trimethylamine dehydrogenase